MKQLLKEDYNINVERYTKQDGSVGQVAYIDPETSETVYPIKDEIKNRFGARWDKFKKRWFWYLSNDEKKNQFIIDTYINPCIEYLVSVENKGQSERQASDVQAEVAKLIKSIETIIAAPVAAPSQTSSTAMSPQQLKSKLAAFKDELVGIMSSEEFKRKMEPIIKFKQAQGHQFSFINSILVMIQDSKATMVKSKTRWNKMNRDVLPQAPSISLWCPKGGTPLTKEQKEETKRRFLERYGASSVRDLTPGQRERLDVALNHKSMVSFELMPRFYDIRFTKQIEGTEDVVGDQKAIENLEWFEDGEETEFTEKLANAILKTIEQSGVALSYSDKLGDARGVSKSGKIEISTKARRNAGFVNTCIHEFAHECLHQKYLKESHNGSEWSSFFVGTSEGRGQVEQQAELTAWIVLKSFNIDLNTSFNYMGCWGMDEKNASKVFDSVANVANAITSSMQKNMEGEITESKQTINEMISGLDVAKMVGLEQLYNKSKEEQQYDEFDNTVSEALNKVLKNFINENISRKPKKSK